MNSTASVTINNSNEMRDEIAFRVPRQSTFRLESEIRHATDAGAIRNFTTLLNSGDPATLLPGARHA